MLSKKNLRRNQIIGSVYDKAKEDICRQIVESKKLFSKKEKNRETYNYHLKQIKYLKDKLNEREEQDRGVKTLRKEFENYDNYLKIWDLVEGKKSKGGRWTWKEIARELFPDDFKEPDPFSDDETTHMPNPESAIKKVQKYFRKANTLSKKMGLIAQDGTTQLPQLTVPSIILNNHLL